MQSLSTCALLFALCATAGQAAPAGSSGRFSKLKNMAGKPQSGIAPDGVTEHIHYTSRELRSKIHAPLRATQLGGSDLGKTLERVLTGGWFEHMAIAGEMFQNPDLDELFTTLTSKPEYSKYTAQLLENIPMANLVRGVPEIVAKGQDITTEDSVKALGLMRDFAAKSIELMTNLAKDPSVYIAERMAKLESGEYPELLALFEQAGAGDQAAAIQAQQLIVEEELGGLFDFSAMGLNGIEPDFHKKMVETALNDKYMKPFVEDMGEVAQGFATSPMTIVEQAEKLMEAI